MYFYVDNHKYVAEEAENPSMKFVASSGIYIDTVHVHEQ